MDSRKIRGAVVDELNGHIYYSDNRLYRIIRGDLDTGGNSYMIDNSPADSEGGQTDAIFVTGMVLDIKTNYLYWAYRGPSLKEGRNAKEYYDENPLHRSGIKRIKLSDISLDMVKNKSKIEYFIEGIEAYGIAIGGMEREVPGKPNPDPIDPIFSYETTTLNKILGDKIFINPLKSNTDGQLSYGSSKSAVATINLEGEVTIKGEGSTTITAMAAATEKYKSAKASYKLIVGSVGVESSEIRDVIIDSTNEVIQIFFEGEATIEVYNINGKLIESIIAYEKYNILLERGIYIIKINDKIYKVIK